MPMVSGSEPFARYRAARGPGNIPSHEMWQLHTRLEADPMDRPHSLEAHAEALTPHERFGTAPSTATAPGIQRAASVACLFCPSRSIR